MVKRSMQMTKELRIQELKALAFDVMRAIENDNRQLAAVLSEIRKLEAEAPVGGSDNDA
jgi:hypothetical protein